MTPTVSVVTSFSEGGYDRYGRRFVETFCARWPPAVDLLIYHEGRSVPVPAVRKVRQYDLITDIPRCAAFLALTAGDRVAEGREPNQPHPWREKWLHEGYAFRWDARRFARKVFAAEHAYGETFSDWVVWLDADVVTWRDVPESFLAGTLDPAADLIYLGRKESYHSECGFVAYRRCVTAAAFLREFSETYLDGRFRDMREWHDSYVFDRVRERTPVRAKNLGADVRHGHVFVYSALGDYMDHLKGDERKARGFSPEHPRRTHAEAAADAGERRG